MVQLLSISDRPHLPEVRVGSVISCHRMAHYVLIRCFLQLSHSEALCECNFFSIRDRPYLSGVRVMEGGSPVTAWRTTCLYGVSDRRATPRLSDGVTSSVSDYWPQTLRGAGGGVRLSCCLSHDRCRDTWDTVPYISPPTFPDGATSSVSGTDRTLSEVRCGKCKKMHSPGLSRGECYVCCS